MGLFDDYGIDPDEIPDGPNYDMEDGVYVFEIGRGFYWESEEDEDGNTRRAFVIEYLLDDEEGTTGSKSEWFNLPADPDDITDAEKQKLSFLKTRLLSLGVPREELKSVEPEDLEGITGTLQLASSAGKGKNRGKTYQNVRNVKVAEADEPTPEVPVKKVAAPAAKTTARAGASVAKKNPFAKAGA